MPGHNYSGGGGFYHQNGTLARNFGHVVNTRDYPYSQMRDIRENRVRPVNSYLAEDENYPSFKAQLSRMGLELRDIPADGNCLFRALGDQLEGHSRNHFKHRADVVNYLRSHRRDFEPFVEDDVSFDEHVKGLQKLGTHAGNDAIAAFARLHNVNVVIHQLGGRPLLIQGPITNSETVPQLHLSYHNGQHYSSVRRMDDNTESPANVCLQSLTTEMKSHLKNDSQRAYAGVVSAKRGLEDIEAGVALATNCMDRAKIRRVLLSHDYDVDASIADLLQQMKLSDNSRQADSLHHLSQRTHTADNGRLPASDSLHQLSQRTHTAGNGRLPASDSLHQLSQRTHMADNGRLPSSAGSSGYSSPNSAQIAGGVLKANGHSYANGKGHKVHFREDSIGSSSGYESLHSYPMARVNPKLGPEQQHSYNTMKDSKSRKIDKKKLPEDKGRQRALDVRQTFPQASGVRDVAVVGLHNGRVKRH